MGLPIWRSMMQGIFVNNLYRVLQLNGNRGTLFRLSYPHLRRNEETYGKRKKSQ